MALVDVLFLIPGPPALSAALTLLALAAILYLAREPSHRAAVTVGTAIHRAFRLLASYVTRVEEKLVARNREVLLAKGEAAAERSVEREFGRIQALVDRDLRGYPALHRQLSEQVQRIDAAFLESAEISEEPRVWLEAVEAVAALKDEASPEVASVLAELQRSIDRGQKQVAREYRRAEAARHRRLRRMRPAWQRVESVLDRVGRDVGGLRDRSKRIDEQMERFRQITEGEERVARTLETTAMTRFAAASLVLVVAFGGALLHFFLIAGPMRLMVGEGTILGPILLADVSAIVLILIGLTMGLFLLESLGITRLFPTIGWLDDRRRRWISLATLATLLVLAALGAALTVTRESLAATGPTQSVVDLLTVPLVVQSVLAFILPFALAFVAIPLEALLSSGRTVAGTVLVGVLRTFRFVLRTIGAIGRGMMRLVPRAYDLTIFVPLWIERTVVEWQRARTGSGSGDGGDDLAASRGSGSSP